MGEPLTQPLQRPEHPGSGRRQARVSPKGRQAGLEARAAIEALLGGSPRRRDLLIEFLHRIQDRHGQIPADLLAALAEALRLSYAEVYEVATFYAHFDVVKEGEPALPPLAVRVCDSLTCAMHGATALHETLAGMATPGMRVVRAPCLGLCNQAPVVEVGHHFLHHATPATVLEAVSQGDTQPHMADYVDLDRYGAAGGYQLLARLRAGELDADAVLTALEHAGLRGLGGAGFPTGRKWRAVRDQPGPRLMAVNGDEGEPGTFKDRHYLNTDPHRFLEGTLIAAHVVEAEEVFIYLRDEYPLAREILTHEMGRLPPGGPVLHLRRGAGAYICGEESALLESLEGKRGLPRHKPPFPFQRGLFGRPTLINNVETLYWIRDILERGPDWWAGHGRHGGKGLRSFSVSGRVREPGVKLAPAGITMRELLAEHCGGMAEGHELVAFLPGGASGGILPAAMADLPLDFGTLEPHGCFIGSAAVIVLSQADDLRAAALNLMRFFEDESCGQCTPCRVGTQKARLLMEQPDWDAGLLGELSDMMRDASICGLGQAASNPLISLLRHFPKVAGGGGSSA
jgi:NADH:ubiquinone oxidoreductase subunit F (NADH-binding)/NADH:ubiquinone oxidoreductase subunit E